MALPGVAALLQEGLEHHRAGRLDEAEALYREALRLEPQEAEALRLLGAIAAKRGGHEAAVALFQEALALRPDIAYCHNDLGLALAALRRLDEAEAAYREALRLAPEFAEAAINLALLVAAAGRWEEAEQCCRRALALAPQAALVHASLGLALAGLDRFAEAEAALCEAQRLKPDDPAVHLHLGGALNLQNRPGEAALSYCRAIALDPDSAAAHLNLALSLLGSGEFEEGWREYEWRWHSENGPRRPTAPLWKGEPLAGKRILLYAEQGFGDAIHFMRYAPLVRDRGGRVVLEVGAELLRLAGTLDGPESIVVAGGPEPLCDFASPLLSLPLRFGTTLATIPARVPYLAADPDDAARWRARLAPLPGLRVGLVWAGNPDLGAALDRRRSIPLGHFAPLAGLKGLSLVSLQKGEAARQAALPPKGLVLHDWTQELADFADTAALVAALDLVVGVDTAVVHLAGALGKPVWVLSRFDADWRWLLDREDSPWYPSLRLFRQKRPGDWAEIIDKVAAALSRHHRTEDPAA
jgi:Flp pilus assembly protein TadD